MPKTGTRVTPAEVVEWRKLSAKGKSNHEIGRQYHRSHMTVGNHLTGKQVAREPGSRSTNGIPDVCAETTCGVRGTKRLPLVRNADGKHRCPECGGRWRAAKTLERIRAALQAAQREGK